MKTLNTTPTAQIPLVALATEALSGLLQFGPALEVMRNTAAAVGLDLRTLIGDPGSPGGVPNVGRQGEFNEAVAQHAAARAELRASVKTARQFVTAALALLKNSLGAKLNSRWREVGFTLKTLAIAQDPVPVLVELRAFYRLHPERQSAEQNLTASRADALLTELQERGRAVGEKRTAEAVARRARNAAQKALYRRISHLRGELAQILTKDDPRWYAFGFKRPTDSRTPDAVTALESKPALPGEVRVTWPAAPRAVNYRVKWRTDAEGSAEKEAGLFADRDVTLHDLPSGTPIIVSVTARNVSGESAPTELRVVPRATSGLPVLEPMESGGVAE